MMTMQDKTSWIGIGGLTLVTALSAPAVFAAGEHEGGHGQESGGHMDESGGHGHGDGGHGHGGHDFGAAAPESEADRTIEIVARDNMRFEPAAVSIESGETVRFVVRNAGKIQHSFTLGSPEYQHQHEQEMQGMDPAMMAGHMDESSNGIVVQPGTTDSLTWRFEKGGPVQFACHIPGHYPAGMKGVVHLDRDGGDEMAYLTGQGDQ